MVPKVVSRVLVEILTHVVHHHQVNLLLTNTRQGDVHTEVVQITGFPSSLLLYFLCTVEYQNGSTF